LKKANRRDARSASPAARKGILGGNSADGDHRDGYSPANFLQFFQSLRSTKLCFCRRRKNGPEENIIRRILRRMTSSVERVARHANQKVRETRRPPLFCKHADRQRIFAGVHAASAGCPSYVPAIIHQNARFASARRPREIPTRAHCGTGKVRQLSRRQIFLADLHPVNSRPHGCLDLLRQGNFAILAGRSIQRVAVRYVANNEFVFRLQGLGTGILSGPGLAPQHSRGDDDIERAQTAHNASHSRMQDERTQARILAHEIVTIPQSGVIIRGQADPRYEQKKDSHLEYKKRAEDTNHS
jgi:hypothetical protein